MSGSEIWRNVPLSHRYRELNFIKDKAVTQTITGIYSNRVEVYYVRLIWTRVVQQSLQLMNNSVRQLEVFVDNSSLLRCGGRINNPNVPCDVKFSHLKKNF